MKIKAINYIATFFGVGLIKKIPGSIASLITAILWYIVICYFNFTIILLLLLVTAISLIAYYSIKEYQKITTDTNNTDPQEIVIDEVAGMSIAIIGSAFFFSLQYFILAFIIFRVLDSLKPSIVYRFEIDKRDSSILMDDILSGLITLLIMLALGSSNIV